MRAEKKKAGKRSVAVVAVLLVCIMALGGTIAWLTSTSTLDNKFTVGMIKPVDPNKPGPIPGKPTIPEEDRTPEAGKLDGNLYEPSWKQNSKLMPGISVAKDPYVGVGAGSEPSYVYVYVKNSMANNNHIYFKINAGWEAVEAQQIDSAGNYTGGLFKYTAGLDGSAQSNNTWTTQPLFSNVVVDNAAEAKDFVDGSVVSPNLDGNDKLGTIKVQSFVHQMNDAEGHAIDETSVVIPAAKTAFGIGG